MAKSKWLQEVEDDANRIATKRFKDYFEELEYQKEKNNEAQVAADDVEAPEVKVKKGK